MNNRNKIASLEYQLTTIIIQLMLFLFIFRYKKGNNYNKIVRLYY